MSNNRLGSPAPAGGGIGVNATPSPEPDMNRNRLPTLFEVLSRRTLPPVDLFSFYIYMRDQQRSVDYLDFWYVLEPNAQFLLFEDN